MTQALNEGIPDWFKRNHFAAGQKTTNKLLAQSQKKWDNYRGRALEDWTDVTWETLYSWLTTPDNFGLKRDEINIILKNKRVVNKIKSYIDKFGANKWEDYQETFLKPDEPIAGPDSMANEVWREKIAKAVSDIIIEFSLIFLMKKLSGAQDVGDPSAGNKPSDNIPVTSSSSLDQLKLAKEAVEAAIKEIEG